MTAPMNIKNDLPVSLVGVDSPWSIKLDQQRRIRQKLFHIVRRDIHQLS